MKRSAPIRRDGPGARAFAAKRSEIKRTKPIAKENRKRKAKLVAKQFGRQAALCRLLPCCACNPELYGLDMLGLGLVQGYRVSDPHHETTCGAGGEDKDTVPLCTTCHVQLGSPGWSQKRLEMECGVVLRDVAARLHRHLNPTTDEGWERLRQTDGAVAWEREKRTMGTRGLV